MCAKPVSSWLCLGLALGLVAPVNAQTEPPRPLQIVQASRVIYDTGVALRDPVMIVAAAKLRRTAGLARTARTPEAGDGDKADAPALDWAAMLDTARDMAAGDDLLTGLIEDAAAEANKGVANGPVYNIANLGARGEDLYRPVPFDGNRYAEIYVETKGSNDVNLFVYDAQGRLVCSDTDISAIAYCGWNPRESGNFSIKVTNESGASLQYSLMTN